MKSRSTFVLALSLVVIFSSCKSPKSTGPVATTPEQSVEVIVPEPVKTSEAKLTWSEERVAAMASKLSEREVVEVQVLLKAAAEGTDHCSFSQDWLASGPQFFRGEWDTYFSSKGALQRQRVCGMRLEALAGHDLEECAKKLKPLCEKLR